MANNQRPDRVGSSGWTALQPLELNGPRFGPEIGFGEVLSDARIPAAIIKVAKDGTCLAEGWTPDGAPERVALLDEVSKARATLGRHMLAGFVWVQGECDAGRQASAAAYESNLREFIGSMRNHWDVPHLPVTIAALHPDLDREYRGLVFDAQVSYTKTDSASTLVQIGDLELGGDHIHYSDTMMLETGRRLARAALAALSKGAGGSMK